MSKNINGTIYLWTNSANGQQYVGLTTRSAETRQIEYINESKLDEPRSAIARAIKEYRPENFDFNVLPAGITDWKTLNEMEIVLIAEYDS